MSVRFPSIKRLRPRFWVHSWADFHQIWIIAPPYNTPKIFGQSPKWVWWESHDQIHGYISATGHPIHLMFGSTIGVSGSAGRMTIHKRAVREFDAQPSSSFGVWPCDSCSQGNVSLGGLGAGRIAYWLEGCGLQNHTCGLFSLKPGCDNSAIDF